eukprot:GEMP01040357.1.p1 GENE.GEMP01040357.1~~GEMP01040357.1.p1  ORF type:complete len:189 (+),score=23.55 GEMP01040357.1:67-633(+)
MHERGTPSRSTLPEKTRARVLRRYHSAYSLEDEAASNKVPHFADIVFFIADLLDIHSAFVVKQANQQCSASLPETHPIWRNFLLDRRYCGYNEWNSKLHLILPNKAYDYLKHLMLQPPRMRKEIPTPPSSPRKKRLWVKCQIQGGAVSYVASAALDLSNGPASSKKELKTKKERLRNYINPRKSSVTQ